MKLSDYPDFDEYLQNKGTFSLGGKFYPLGDLYDYSHENKLIYRPAAGTDIYRAAERAIGYARDNPENDVFVVAQDDVFHRVTKDDAVADVVTTIAGKPVPKTEWVPPPVMCVVEAANDGNLARVKVLVEELGEDVNKRNDNDWPALNRAAYHGHTEICAYLLEKGARIDSPDNFGFTPLHLAGMGGQDMTAQFLLDHGANVEARDRENKLPVDIARGNRCGPTVAVLEKHQQWLDDERSGVAAQRRSDELTAAIAEHTVLQKPITPSAVIKIGKPKT